MNIEEEILREHQNVPFNQAKDIVTNWLLLSFPDVKILKFKKIGSFWHDIKKRSNDIDVIVIYKGNIEGEEIYKKWVDDSPHYIDFEDVPFNLDILFKKS